MAQIFSGTHAHCVHSPGASCFVRSVTRLRSLRPLQVSWRFRTCLIYALQYTLLVCENTADTFIEPQEQHLDGLAAQSQVPCLLLNLVCARCSPETPFVHVASGICIRPAWSLLLRVQSHLACHHRHHLTASATASPPAPSAAGAPAHQQEAPVLPFRVGYGFDLHRLVEGKKLIICGVDVPHVRGCDAHSDGKRCSELW